MSDVIYSFTGKHRFLSNFYMEPNKTSVEHRFQAQKTLVLSERRWIIDSRSPGEAKRRGRSVTLRPDWESIKVERMRMLVETKFVRWRSLRVLLVDTGSAELIEGNTWGDDFWGKVRRDGQWVGENKLGVILMDTRVLLEGLGRYF